MNLNVLRIVFLVLLSASILGILQVSELDNVNLWLLEGFKLER